MSAGLPAAAGTIPEVAHEAGSFKTLTKALEVAGLTHTLAGEGPFTVFAPTDEAFAKVPADALKALLADRAKLRRVLLDHVAKSRVSAKEVVAYDSVRALGGATHAIRIVDGRVQIGGAFVLKTDVPALRPPAEPARAAEPRAAP